MTDDTVIEATGIDLTTLQDMRTRREEMADMGHKPTGNWSIDQVRHGAIFRTNRSPS